MTREEYIKKLITEIRKAMDNAPENVEAQKEVGDDNKLCLVGYWVDIELLCNEVEKLLMEG